MLGDKLKELRLKHNMTQEELAKSLYVSRQAVTSWESNRSKPDIDTIVELCSLFDVSVEYLLDEENIEPKKRKKGIIALLVISILGALLVLVFAIIYIYTALVDIFSPPHMNPQYSLVGYYLTLDEELMIENPAELKDYSIPYVIYMNDTLEYNLFHYENNEYRLLIPYNSYNNISSYNIYYESVEGVYYTMLSYKNENLVNRTNLLVGSLNDRQIWYEIKDPNSMMSVISYDSGFNAINIDSFYYFDDILYKNDLIYEENDYIQTYYYEGASYYTVKLFGGKTYNLFKTKDIYTNIGMPSESLNRLKVTTFIIK